MKKILIGFMSFFILTAVVKTEKAEAGIIMTLATGNPITGAGIAGGITVLFLAPDLARGTEIDRSYILQLVGFSLLMNEEADIMSRELLKEFPGISNEALSITSKEIIKAAEETSFDEDGLKEVVLNLEVASKLQEFADFDSDKEAKKFYEMLTTKVIN
jgi:hypothetical protein